jgi:guanylate kinase
MRKTKRIILVGHAASGKDYLAEKFVAKGYKKDVSLTTRPIRDGEQEGYHYHYVSDEFFDSRVNQGDFYEVTQHHNNWRYGTLNESWEHSDVFIMNPHGVSTIKPEDRKDCVVVYLEIRESVRRKRMDLRSDSDTTERRIAVDKKMFKGFVDYDFRINDPNFNADSWVSLLGKIPISKAEAKDAVDTQG